jgi:hypothetical protein
MDEVALAIAGLECGHADLLGVERNSIDERLAISGREVLSSRSGAPHLGATADGVAGQDVIAGPVELSDHPLCVVGIVLREAMLTGGSPPLAGAGPVRVGAIARALEVRDRDGGSSLIGSLRALETMNMIVWHRDSDEVFVGVALAGQPRSVFDAVERLGRDDV